MRTKETVHDRFLAWSKQRMESPIKRSSSTPTATATPSSPPTTLAKGRRRSLSLVSTTATVGSCRHPPVISLDNSHDNDDFNNDPAFLGQEDSACARSLVAHVEKFKDDASEEDALRELCRLSLVNDGDNALAGQQHRAALLKFVRRKCRTMLESKKKTE